MEILVNLRSTLLGEALAQFACSQTSHRALRLHCDDPRCGSPPDLILCDGANCPEDLQCRWPEARILLVSTGADEKGILSQLVTRRVDGVLTADMEPHMLEKAMEVVGRGDFWLPHQNIREILDRAGSLRSGRVADLSATQRRIARLVAQGLTNREIADAVHLSEATVKGHVSHLLHLMNLSNRTQLAKVILDGEI